MFASISKKEKWFPVIDHRALSLVLNDSKPAGLLFRFDPNRNLFGAHFNLHKHLRYKVHNIMKTLLFLH